MTESRLRLAHVAERLEEAGILLGVHGPLGTELAGVTQDSRKVQSGDLFLAWKGMDHDAHDYVISAVKAGAVAAVVEEVIPDLPASQLHVGDGRLAGALAADQVFRSPWKELWLSGITGTNGKTTTTVLARHLLAEKGPARAIGTLGLLEEDGAVRKGTEGLTTPGPVQISRWLREMADERIRFVSMEVSSHALAQRRLDGTRLDAAVFTNLSQDHLDYHSDLEEYRLAKVRILELLKPEGWAIVNRDQRAWRDLTTPQGRTLFFGFASGEAGSGSGGAERLQDPTSNNFLAASDLRTHPRGSDFWLQIGGETARVELPLLGHFNVENAMAAAAVAWVGGVGLQTITGTLSRSPQVPGRLERVADEPFPVIIDYAHTPDALARVLQTLRPLVRGRLMVLFGAGGDRDRGKRPLMGEAAARYADLSFVTSDNPRTENPKAIIQDILEGMEGSQFRQIPDRREAIAAALGEGRPGDLLLLAGKGHETYQVVGVESRPFDEKAIVREMLGSEDREEVS